jgi:hypothetical protein
MLKIRVDGPAIILGHGYNTREWRMVGEHIAKWGNNPQISHLLGLGHGKANIFFCNPVLYMYNWNNNLSRRERN